MSDTQLRIGAQSEAARLVLAAVDPIQATLERLGDTVQGASDGFRGGAAAGLSEALEAWYSAAGDLVPTLHEYAARLVAVDTSEARTEQAQQESYGRLAARLGGAR